MKKTQKDTHGEGGCLSLQVMHVDRSAPKFRFIHVFGHGVGGRTGSGPLHCQAGFNSRQLHQFVARLSLSFSTLCNPGMCAATGLWFMTVAVWKADTHPQEATC